MFRILSQWRPVTITGLVRRRPEIAMPNRFPSLAGLFIICLQAQPQTPASSSFEVASVKKHKPGDRRGGGPEFLPGGKFTTSGAPLYILIAIAYDLPFQSDRLTGGRVGLSRKKVSTISKRRLR